jgi:hypothetical protein
MPRERMQIDDVYSTPAQFDIAKSKHGEQIWTKLETETGDNMEECLESKMGR